MLHPLLSQHHPLGQAGTPNRGWRGKLQLQFPPAWISSRARLMGAGSKGCCPSGRQGGRADVSQEAQSLLCSLASGWAAHPGGCDAHFLGHPGGITACAPGEAPGCFGLGQRFGDTFENPEDLPPLGSGMCPQCGFSGRYIGQTSLRVRQAGSLWILSFLPHHPWLGNGRDQPSPSRGSDLCCKG